MCQVQSKLQKNFSDSFFLAKEFEKDYLKFSRYPAQLFFAVFFFRREKNATCLRSIQEIFRLALRVNRTRQASRMDLGEFLVRSEIFPAF